jgi:hypothetical protein
MKALRSLKIRRRIACIYFCLFSLKGIPLGIMAIVLLCNIRIGMQLGTGHIPLYAYLIAYVVLGFLLVPGYIIHFFSLSPWTHWPSNIFWILSALYNLPTAFIGVLSSASIASRGTPKDASLPGAFFVLLITVPSLLGILFSVFSIDFHLRPSTESRVVGTDPSTSSG